MNISNFHALGSKISFTNSSTIISLPKFKTLKFDFFDSLNAWLITWNADYLAYVANKAKGQILKRR